MNFYVGVATASLYLEPSVQSERVDEVLHGMRVTVEKDYGEWGYASTDYGYEGWVELGCLTGSLLPISGQAFYINVAAADVLVAPKVRSLPLICLTLGCVVRVVSDLDVPDGWAKVLLADGRIGYVRSGFLSPAPKIIEAPVSASQKIRNEICETAKLYLGTQYRWGGKTPLGIDCSGLCFMAYWLNGISIYRDACIRDGFPVKKISPLLAREADLLFFPGHVGMLLDEGRMIHSSEANQVVKVEAVTQEWREHVTAAGSVW